MSWNIDTGSISPIDHVNHDQISQNITTCPSLNSFTLEYLKGTTVTKIQTRIDTESSVQLTELHTEMRILLVQKLDNTLNSEEPSAVFKVQGSDP